MLIVDSWIDTSISSMMPERFSYISLKSRDVFNLNQIKTLFETKIQFLKIFSGGVINTADDLRLNLFIKGLELFLYQRIRKRFGF